jgi:hypothetical protein
MKGTFESREADKTVTPTAFLRPSFTDLSIYQTQMARLNRLVFKKHDC